MNPEQERGEIQNPVEKYFDTIGISAQAKAIFRAGDSLFNREIDPNNKKIFLEYREESSQLRKLVGENPEAWLELVDLKSFLDNYDDQGREVDFIDEVIMPISEVCGKIRSVLP